MSGRSRGDNWRNEIVNGVRWHGKLGDEYNSADGIDLEAGCGLGDPPDAWPVLPNAILGRHDYVGPYLVACDHGCFHSGDHATSIEFGHGYDVSSARSRNREQIKRLCMDAMSKADILFFWFDSLDAYGTLAELVFMNTCLEMHNLAAIASGRKEVKQYYFVASPDFNAIDQMWLAFRLVSKTTFLTAETPRAAFTQTIAQIEDAVEYSPIEKAFIEKWRAKYGNGIYPQFDVPGFRYRVDFAFPQDKVAIELDGYEYHNSKEQFTKDRQRQRDMELAGWRFVRFSGSEIYKDVAACVDQAYAFWQSFTNDK